MFGWFSGLFMNMPFLLGTLAASIPIIIHLAHRRRAPRVQFTTLRFIRSSAERTARRRRVEEWILLALRTAAIFLLALALAGPIIRAAHGGGGKNAAVALVIDNSYSMDAKFEGRSRHAYASEYARDILRDLTGDSLAALVTPCPAPDGIDNETLTTDRNRLADTISLSRLSIVSSDLSPAITRAEKMLASAPVSHREIYVLSDMQKEAWRSLPPLLKKQHTAMFLIDCGAGNQANLSVTDISIRSTRPTIGVPLKITARIRNLGNKPTEVPVGLYVERDKRAESTLLIEPNAVAEVEFTHTFTTPGAHAGWVDATAEDALNLDNRHYFTVEVLDRTRVAVLRQKDGALPQLDDAFFLLPALNPGIGRDASPSAIEPVKMLRKDLLTADLLEFAAVFVLNLPELSSQEMNALRDYAIAGGGVVIFPGDRVQPDAWNSESALVTTPSGTGLLPARIGDIVDLVHMDEPVVIGEVDMDHDLFSVFRSMPPEFFKSVQVGRCFNLEVEHGTKGIILARLTDGRPFLTEKRIGQGRVLMFCTAANASWSNLPLRKLYLPLLHQITYYLARNRGTATSYAAGESVLFPAQAGSDSTIDVTTPDGTVSRTVPMEAEQVSVFKDTHTPGIYRWEETGDRQRSGAFAINADNPKESDLQVLSEEEIRRQFLNGREAYFVADADEAIETADRLRRGVSLTDPILFIVLAVIVAECFFANHKLAAAPVVEHGARPAGSS